MPPSPINRSSRYGPMRAPGRAPEGSSTTGSLRKSSSSASMASRPASSSASTGVFAAQCGQVFAALLGGELEQGIEQRRQALPAFGVHRAALAPRPQAAGVSRREASRNIRAFCQSRRTLRSERFSSAAISSSDRPAK